MRARLTTCLVIGAGLFGILGAAYSHSPVPLVLMLLLGGVIGGIAMMSLDTYELRRMTRFAAYEIRYLMRTYFRRPQHSLKFRKRLLIRMKGLNVR
jgi:hypothetical protein